MKRMIPWTTLIACGAMVVVFLGLHLEFTDSSPVLWGIQFASFRLDVSPEALARWGYRDTFTLWRGAGAQWALVTSAFVHTADWHLLGNLYWMWRLGRAVESAIGSLRLLLFLLVAAFVSSAAQLAVSSNTGIGASGMVYALFSFGWLARERLPTLQQVFTRRIAAFALIWLVFCGVFLARFIANGAHVGGLLFGAAVAESFVTGRRPRLARVGAAAVLLLSIAVSFVCPWSSTWWAVMGHEFYNQHDYVAAAKAYNFSLRLSPNDTWVLQNLVHAEKAAGNERGAHRALVRLKAVAPEKAAALEATASIPEKH